MVILMSLSTGPSLLACQQLLLGAHYGAKHRLEVQDKTAGTEEQPWSATVQDKGDDGEI